MRERDKVRKASKEARDRYVGGHLQGGRKYRTNGSDYLISKGAELDDGILQLEHIISGFFFHRCVVEIDFPTPRAARQRLAHVTRLHTQLEVLLRGSPAHYTAAQCLITVQLPILASWQSVDAGARLDVTPRLRSMPCSTVRFTPLLTHHGDTFQMAVRAGPACREGEPEHEVAMALLTGRNQSSFFSPTQLFDCPWKLRVFDMAQARCV